MLQKAEQIAARHGDDHPFRVASRVEEPDKVVALLHDSLEDGYSNLQEIGINFHGQVMHDVIVLTRLHDEDYFDYIRKIIQRGGRARRVKIADIQTNLERCYKDPVKWRKLIQRYEMALAMLEAE